VVALLNRFFAAVVTVAGEHGGWVDKFEGDGALCVFGAPVVHEDHAARALRSARELAVALRQLQIDAGIGVATGTVVAGNVGTEERLEYTVIGAAVNEAARLTELAKQRPGHALADARVVAAGDSERHHWQSAGEVSLRGIGDAVAVCEPAA
jgi:adenylate cyclase